MSTRPIRLVGAHALRAIELRALSALLVWAQDWLPDATPEPTLRVQSPLPSAVTAFKAEMLGDEVGRVWFRHLESDDRALAAALLGAPPARSAGDGVLEATFAEARRALHRAIAEVLVVLHGEPVDVTPDAKLWAFGSGAVQIDCEAIGLHMIADDGVLRHVPPLERPAAVLPQKMALDKTLARAPLRVDVMLGSADLELGPLLELQTGDVIRLPARLSDSAAIEIDGRCVAQGRLGMHDGRRAVQLVAAPGDFGRERR